MDATAFAAFHNPGLPSTVILAPDGKLAHYHSGVVPDAADTLRAEVLSLLPETRNEDLPH